MPYPTVLNKALSAVCLIAALASPAPVSAQASKLPALNVSIRETSVSGLSAGGFMAVQFGVAYSSIVKGAGIVAGGPYGCAQKSVITAQLACMLALMPTDVDALIRMTDQNASAQTIDPTSNLAHQKIWMFSGTMDSVVKQSVMNDLNSYYRHFVGKRNVKYIKNVAAEHAMPTNSFGNACSFRGDPYINNCQFDAAGKLLTWIYGPLKPKNTGTLDDQRLIKFDQGEFIDNPHQHSMDEHGWIYVPASCANGEPCKLHVVFHGCEQYPSKPTGKTSRFDATYVRNAGYNRWADTNSIVVLYPQVYTGGDIKDDPEALANPKGCWDWWAYDDANYATKTGSQMRAIKAMIDRISSGEKTSMR
jgi:poly(3-hydroxybutyrate) depolymerase